MLFVGWLVVDNPKEFGFQKGRNRGNGGITISHDDESVIAGVLCHIIDGSLEVCAAAPFHLKCLLVLLCFFQGNGFSLYIEIEHQHIYLLDAIFEEGSDDAVVTSQPI